MANYKKYAEDLIGNWETSQYEPQRTVTQNIYQTNWNKLSNDFNTLKDKLARNFSNAQMEYGNILNDVQNESFNRMRNADIDLATRGLSTSGVGNLIQQADIQQKGQDIDKALNNLLGVSSSGIEGLTQGVTNLGQKQSSLASGLAKDLGGITGQEAENAQQYANLVAGLGQSAEGRAANRRSSGGGSSGKTKEDESLDEMYRSLGIIQTLNDTSLTDDEKRTILVNSYDVDRNTASNAITGYNNNNLLDTTTARIGRLQRGLDTSNRISGALNNLSTYGTRANALINTSSPANKLAQYLVQGPAAINNLYNSITENSLNRQRNRISGLDYSDLNDILFGLR